MDIALTLLVRSTVNVEKDSKLLITVSSVLITTNASGNWTNVTNYAKIRKEVTHAIADRAISQLEPAASIWLYHISWQIHKITSSGHVNWQSKNLF